MNQLSRLGLYTLLSGVFLALMDFSVVNIALADIGRDLHTGSSSLELVVAGYAVAYSLGLVLGGRLGDAIGRRRMFVGGMAAFTLTSALCGLAPTANGLVTARVLQGFSAAAMVPQVLATLQATTTGEHRARALAAFGATGGFAAVLGQVGGGFIVSANLFGSGWRPVFLINVPVGIVAIIVSLRVLPDTRSDRPAAPDFLGTALLGATVLSILVPLVEGRVHGWPVWSWVLLALALPFAAALLRTENRLERKGTTPLLPPSLLALQGVRRGLAIGLPFFSGFGGFMFVYAVLTQSQLGWSPAKAGGALAPMMLAFLVASLQSARLVARWGRSVITTGGVLQLVGLVLVAAEVASAGSHLAPVGLAPGLLVAGAGQAMVMIPLIGVVLADVPPYAAGAASGLFSTLQQTALALGVAVYGTVFLDLLPRYGEGKAFLLAEAVQIVSAVGVVALSRRLPSPAPATASQVEAEPAPVLIADAA